MLNQRNLPAFPRCLSPQDQEIKSMWIGSRSVDLLGNDKEILSDAECASEIDISANHDFFMKCVDLIEELPEELQDMLEAMAAHVAENEFNKLH